MLCVFLKCSRGIGIWKVELFGRTAGGMGWLEGGLGGRGGVLGESPGAVGKRRGGGVCVFGVF